MVVNQLIYVVDDGADYRFLLQQVFFRFLPDLHVRFFESGDALYQHMLSESNNPAPEAHPALIIMDLNMPGLSGFQTLVLLRQQPIWKQVPVVMMTSEGSEEEIEQCYKAGANSFVFKPTEFMALKSTLTDICQYWTNLNQRTYS